MRKENRESEGINLPDFLREGAAAVGWRDIAGVLLIAIFLSAAMLSAVLIFSGGGG